MVCKHSKKPVCQQGKASGMAEYLLEMFGGEGAAAAEGRPTYDCGQLCAQNAVDYLSAKLLQMIQLKQRFSSGQS